MFRVNVEQSSNDAARLVLEGDLDVRTSPELREELDTLIAQGARSLIIDLNQIGYVDSTGLGALVRGVQQLRRVDGDLKLVCDSRRVRRIFEIAGLTRVIEFLPSTTESSAAEAA